MVNSKALQVIYQPSGRAREYANWAASLFRGCDNFCEYCFSPKVLRMDKDKFHSEVTARADIKRKFESDCKKLNGSGISVLFSFTCDPYPKLDSEIRLTRWGIQMLHEHGMHVNILTKGKNATRDIDLLGMNDAFACTLTFCREDDSLKWEPNAALPDERMAALRSMHLSGVHTWASLEPVLDPKQTLELIRRTHEYVDLYKVGTLNHYPNQTDWKRFGNDAIELLEKLGKAYYIKEDLRKYLD